MMKIGSRECLEYQTLVKQNFALQTRKFDETL